MIPARSTPIDAPGAGREEQAGDRRARGADTEADDPDILDALADDLERVDERGGHHDRSAVLVVVEHGDVEQLREAPLDLEAPRRRDVLEVDTAEDRRDVHHRVDDLVDILRGQADREGVDAAELLEEHRLSLHDRDRRVGPDVAETEHRAAVGDDGDRVALDGEVAHAAWILGDGHADPRHPGRVHHREVVAGSDRVSRRDLDLAAEVRKERAVRVFEHLHAGHARHPLDELLGVVFVGGEHRDVADDAVALDPNDVERADVAADAADRRGELAEHPRPVHDAAPRGEGEARGRMLDHGAAHLDARGRRFSVSRSLSPRSSR